MPYQEKRDEPPGDGFSSNQNQMKKHGADHETKSNCFMLCPKELSVTWAEDERYWSWTTLKENPSEGSIEVLELEGVCWLDVRGKFQTARLIPETLYEVVFVVKLTDPAYGWEVPVNFRLVLPNGEKKEDEKLMMMQPRYKWLEIPAGEFKTSPGNNGEIEFSMFEHKGGQWKKGLVLKGVAIRPKK